MRFLSICSGIEAASVAFQPLGWEAVAFAEIEPFPAAVLAHHYPQVPNLGDMTRFREWDAELLASADMLCGGTPCQAFSVAGLRGSLDDERGNLTLTFCHLYDHLDDLRARAGRAPAVCLWENVPGVLSTADNAFGTFLAGLAGESVPLQPPGGKWTHAGYVRGPRRAVAYRVLDAQYFGLAQRRQRVFVVASADPAFDPAQILLIESGMPRHHPPRREAGEGTAHTLSARTKGGGGLGTDAECDGAVIAEGMPKPECGMRNEKSFAIQPVAPTLNAHFGKKWGLEDQHINNGAGLFAVTHSLLLELPSLREQAQVAQYIPEVAGSLEAQRGQRGQRNNPAHETWVTETAHTLRGEGFDASEDGTGRGTPLVPEKSAPAIAVPEYLSGTACVKAEEVSPALGALNPTAVAFQPRIARNGRGDMGEIVNALNAHSGTTGKGDAAPCVAYTLHGTREGTQAIDTPTDTAGTIREGTGSAVQNSSNTVALSPSPSPSPHFDSSSPEWRVRRLTPEECEILMGFPIGYTLIPGKHRLRKGDDLRESIDYLMALGFSADDAATLAHCPDGPRYKALGNSWAVPCVRWIGQRIDRHRKQQPLS